MSQKTDLLERLVEAGGTGICAQRYQQTYHVSRLAARIAELRGDRNLINTVPCWSEWHMHRSPQVRYVMVWEGATR